MRRLLIFFLFILLINYPDVNGANKLTSGGFSTTIELSNPAPFAGEIVTATLYANCFDTELVSISSVPTPILKKGAFSLVNFIEVNERPHIIRKDSNEGFAIPIAKYAIQIDKPGKYDLSFSNTNGVLNKRTVLKHPFWGYVEDIEKENIEIIPQKINLSVKKLPENKGGIANSGAIGEFEISLRVPRGEIVVNETAEVIIDLRGTGYLPGEIIPDYETAFGDNIKLKSINSDSETFYDGLNICQKRIWRCEIVPQTVGEVIINQIKFGYFNTNKGVYEEIESSPVLINVESSTIKKEVINV